MSFDRLAPVYPAMERLAAGQRLQRCRAAFLDRIEPPGRVLTLGEGHGRFLGECLRQFPEASITCVDASAAMLRQARRHLKARGLDEARVQWVEADALAWSPPPGVFDLIVTHFFLDCFRADQLAGLIPRMAGGATGSACWLLGDFQLAARGWRRTRSRWILAIMYAFFRATTRLSARSVAPPDNFLRRAGFELKQRTEFEWGLLKSDWWQRGAAV